MSTIEVIGCGEAKHDGEYRGCPFHEVISVRRQQREVCTAVRGNRVIERDDPERPEWCPLAKGEVLVKLRAR
jgi:hypothetical protein